MVEIGLKAPKATAALRRTQVRGVRLASALVGFDFEAHALTFIQAVHSRALDRADMHENVSSTAFWRNEAVALVHIEKLYSSDRHL